MYKRVVSQYSVSTQYYEYQHDGMREAEMKSAVFEAKSVLIKLIEMRKVNDLRLHWKKRGCVPKGMITGKCTSFPA